MPSLRRRHPRRRRRTWLLTGKTRVNVIAPGPIDTAAVAEMPQEMNKAFAAMVPVGFVSVFLLGLASGVSFSHFLQGGPKRTRRLSIAPSNRSRPRGLESQETE